MIEQFKYIKQNAYFHIGFKRLSLQKQGLAMGSYDSADIANLVLFIISEINFICFQIWPIDCYIFSDILIMVQ